MLLKRPVTLISIHALREEGDRQRKNNAVQRKHFYPRPPRGGRHAMIWQEWFRDQFLSTPSARRATAVAVCRQLLTEHFYPRPPRGGRPADGESHRAVMRFLSTPSARRATQQLTVFLCPASISIHALREEGDENMRDMDMTEGHFYPRPPRGGRPALDHAFAGAIQFLSTPSARRATGSAYSLQ